MIRYIIRNIAPKIIRRTYKKKAIRKKAKFVNNLPKLTEKAFVDILEHKLSISKGDVLFVHSSLGMMNLAFSQFKVLNILLDCVGDSGTLIFPTYPKGYSYDFIKSGKIFDINKTPSNTGLLSELARRHKSAIRSLHPTKSVVAIGKNAEEITNSHHLSPYPYDINSPYYKILNYNTKIIGIGVNSTYLSCVHNIDDYLKDDFPVNVYHNEIFEAKCVNSSGETQVVRTYAHNMRKMGFNLPKYFKRYVPTTICKDIIVDGMPFFKAEAKPLFDLMLSLAADKNITIYPRINYKWNKLL